MREWILSEINYGYVKDHSYEVAVLPIGATEPHNLHLPYGTDNYQLKNIGERICENAWEQGSRVVILRICSFATGLVRYLIYEIRFLSIPVTMPMKWKPVWAWLFSPI